MTLRLRCIRCGDVDDMYPLDPYSFGLCSGPCFTKMLAALGDGSLAGVGAMVRFQDRYLKNAERHPTHKALAAELERMGRVTPGTLDEGAP